MIPPFIEAQIAFIIAIQISLPGTAPVMNAASFLVTQEFYLLFLPLVIWCYDRTLGIRLLLLLIFSIGINSAFKIFFHSPRPYWVSTGVQAYVTETSFGLPSTHALGSLVFFGYIASKIKKNWLWIVCIALIILIGFARIYLAAHFVTDVITGWIIGILILFLFLRYEDTMARWLKEKSQAVRIAIAFGGSLLLIGITALAIISLGVWEMPESWAETALAGTGDPISPLSMTKVFMMAGLIFGASAGAVISGEYMNYKSDGSIIQKAARYLTGIFILIMIWLIFRTIIPSEGFGALLMNYIGLAIGGVWITLGAPAMFIKTGLMTCEKK